MEIRRLVRGLLASSIVAVAGATIVPALMANAWGVGWNGTAQLYGFNWDTGYTIYIAWDGSSDTDYDIVSDSTGEYTVVDQLEQQAKTETNYSAYWGLAGSTTTTYSESGSTVVTYGYLDGSCLIPAWNFWFCAVGTNTSYYDYYYPVSASVYSEMDLGGNDWEGSSYMNGSYSWSY